MLIIPARFALECGELIFRPADEENAEFGAPCRLEADISIDRIESAPDEDVPMRHVTYDIPTVSFYPRAEGGCGRLLYGPDCDRACNFIEQHHEKDLISEIDRLAEKLGEAVPNAPMEQAA